MSNLSTQGVPSAEQILQHAKAHGGNWLISGLPGPQSLQVMYLDETAEDTIDGVRLICARGFFDETVVLEPGEEDVFGFRAASLFDNLTFWAIDRNGDKV